MIGFVTSLLVASYGFAGSAGYLYVRSTYDNPISESKTSVRWIFEIIDYQDGTYGYLVKDYDERMQCRAEFFFQKNSAMMYQADCYRIIGGDEVCNAKKYQFKGPALVKHSLIPGDWLNEGLLLKSGEEKNLQATEFIGTTGFVSRFKIVSREISIAKAYAEGMLVDDSVKIDSQTPLKLITLYTYYQDRVTVVLKQLWSSEDDFWLYEEKTGRCSWQVTVHR